MAQKVRGITIELGADFTQVTDAFNKVTKELGGVDKSLKDVNKLLKLDPSNVELLAQKQGYLEEAISLTAQKLLEEQKMLESMPTDANGELTEQQKALRRKSSRSLSSRTFSMISSAAGTTLTVLQPSPSLIIAEYLNIYMHEFEKACNKIKLLESYK